MVVPTALVFHVMIFILHLDQLISDSLISGCSAEQLHTALVLCVNKPLM